MAAAVLLSLADKRSRGASPNPGAGERAAYGCPKPLFSSRYPFGWHPGRNGADSWHLRGHKKPVNQPTEIVSTFPEGQRGFANALIDVCGKHGPPVGLTDSLIPSNKTQDEQRHKSGNDASERRCQGTREPTASTAITLKQSIRQRRQSGNRHKSKRRPSKNPSAVGFEKQFVAERYSGHREGVAVDVIDRD